MNFDRIVMVAAAILPLLAGSIIDTAAAVGLKYPYGLAVDQNSGKVYIADPGTGQISVYNPAQNTVTPFATVTNPFSLAVNSNGLLSAGIVGANGHINVYNPQGQLLNTLPVPQGDSPITMTFDSDNVLYQSNGYASNTGAGEINSYTNDITIAYNKLLSTFGAPITIAPYSRLQTYTEMHPGSKYALAYDNGQVFMLVTLPGASGNTNVYDTQTLLSGHAQDFSNMVAECSFAEASCTAWVNNHIIPLVGSAFAAAVDANHNVFYADPDGSDIAVTGKLIAAKTLLSNLSSAPYGIALDRTRSRLYVSFPSEHLIRAYTVTYTTQNGVKVPALSMPPLIIQ